MYQKSQTKVGKAILQVSRKAPENSILNGWWNNALRSPQIAL